MLHEGLFYQKQNDRVKCMLCPHNCIIGDKKQGRCSVRINENGVLQSTNYGEITSMAVDPVEKKPLYHFKPGRNILSVGSFGCNFSCSFCQNYAIAQYRPKSEYASPEKLIEACLDIKDNIGIAFTYNEPSIWYEYVYETSKKLKESHPEFSVVLVTNGYIEVEPLQKLLPYVDAMNIDLKAFNPKYYEKVCGGDVESVLKIISESAKKTHVEVTTLLVNDLNDSASEVESIASYLGNLDRDIPLHLSRYFPTYKMDRPATDIDVMVESKKIAKKYLNYVYLGNVQGVDSYTYCPKCGELLVERAGYFTEVRMDSNKCPKCGYPINIVF
ncbi:cyclic pyranopterin monophosphate synthase [Clostridium ragsdalei P11]|uniref:Cyclic pyranopterin monophosphate synthase n=1 Tax=Clostridium ragsdalei P11 TaxID=1353534 RepID=A0A1A6AXA7_9CLOT|nr:AmmeMemoRadiSam system radical SAM enzyme [Clostridium ragsdalei]OBR94682.1 cyclic pyranopterin monophosphate synthase [Clostridium ragsdalei P11]